MLYLVLICLSLVSAKKKPTASLADVLKRTQGQLDNLSSSLDGYKKALGAEMGAASDDAQKSVGETVRSFDTEVSDYKFAMNELMEQVKVEMHDYNRELKELEANEADEIKGLGKAVGGITSSSKEDLSALISKVEKVLADMKKKEDDAAAAKKAADEAAAKEAADAAKADDSSAKADDSTAAADSDSAPAAADASADSGSAPAAADASTDASPAAVVAESLVLGEAETWVTSHFVLTVFFLLGAVLVYGFWQFQAKYSPLKAHSKTESDSLVFASSYYQATDNGFKKRY